jgi:ATP-binding cassette, subfamily B, bacterial HlyB/CyaB
VFVATDKPSADQYRIAALVGLLRFHGVNADEAEIRRRSGNSVDVAEMVRCAKAFGLWARANRTNWRRLRNAPLPCIALLRDGRCLFLVQTDAKAVVALNPTSSRTISMSGAEFEKIWDRRVILMKQRAGLAGLARRFGLGRLLASVDNDRRVPADAPEAKVPSVLQRLASVFFGLRKKRATRRAQDGLNDRNSDQSGDQVFAATAIPVTAQSRLAALVQLVRFHGIGVDPEQVRHRFGDNIGVPEMLRCAKEFGLKARAYLSNWQRLIRTPLPAIAVMRDGSCLLLGKASEDQVLVQNPLSPRPFILSRADFEANWDGPIVLMASRAGLVDLSRRFDISWFLGAIHKYRHLLGEVLVASFFLQLFALVSPLFFQVVIDKVLTGRTLSTLTVLVIGLVTISIFETVLGILRTYLFAHTTNRIDVELGARLFRHLLALPISYFQARRVGDSVARVRELENIRNFLTSSALTLVIDLFFAFVFLAVMLLYSPWLTVLVLASFPFYFGISLGATPLFRRRLNEKFARGAENQAFLVESVTGVETLKSMAVEPEMQRRWEEQLAGYVAASFRVTSLGNTASQTVQLISKLVTAGILFFGAKLVIDGSLTVGELVAFNILASRLSAPVLRLAQMWQDFHQARLSVARLGDILNTPAEETFSSGRTALPAMRGDVLFDHVTFRYRVDGPETLHDVSFSVPAGQVVGIVGPSGSGKSTLAKLIQRLYVPESGRVLIDGVDLAMIDSGWLRRQLGVVLQENILFNRSIRDNIALADPGAPIDRIIAAAKLAGAHDFILELREGYDTMVGERGNSLSGGQRQRIAIARALMRDPRILIFDEATSALDYESERIIQQNMSQIAKGRTVFIIAHRLSTVRFADRILTLHNGRLTEDGTHDELIRSGGRYSSLYRMQSGIHEVR